MRNRESGSFRATVHYDGSGFHGWQIQPEDRTVQGDVESALRRLLPEPVRVRASGRTDSGVHAVGQEIAFEAPPRWSPPELRRALNAELPEEIWIEQCRAAPEDFHPRYDASARRYDYLVGTGVGAASPLRRRRVWHVGRTPDRRLLDAAAAALPGERSFAAFAKAGQEERGTRCRVESARWSPTATGELRFAIIADRFLHRMVRYLVSTQVEIATGRREDDELERLLDAPGESGPRPPRPAPPWGLYLTAVRYPDGWNRGFDLPGVAPTPDEAEEAEASRAGGDASGGRPSGRGEGA